ncbi:hypothetical protein NDU88_006309 [Pleurodeles waltl]|uniref:Uncharacterized protein n=1 Tax=Pleurodeles waltl TaxID=8319 RepID=A0AAV7L6Z1_PLEWA|nr:hypothetical protein NDU88_006309 [Pleurodeles waltl]
MHRSSSRDKVLRVPAPRPSVDHPSPAPGGRAVCARGLRALLSGATKRRNNELRGASARRKPQPRAPPGAGGRARPPTPEWRRESAKAFPGN